MKKILVIYPPIGFGAGASISLTDFLNSIDRTKFKITLMAQKCNRLLEGISKKTKQKDIIFYKLTENTNILKYHFNMLYFIFIIFKKFNLIYIIDWDGLWKPAELLSIKFLKIPLVSHIRVRYERESISSFLSLSDLIIGNSDFSLSSLKDTRLPLKRIYNSINLRQFDSGKSSLIPQKGEIKIALVGKVREKKGIMVLIKAAGQLLKKHTGVHFYIVGDDTDCSDGCLEKAKEAVTMNKISDNFTFTGLLYDAPQFMKYMDIVVVPSIFPEPFGRVNIEAMAAAKAVVASNIGGIPEVIEDRKTGLLFPPGDNASLADTIEEIIQNKDLRLQLGINARKVVEEKFDSENQIRLLEDVFDSLIIKKI